MGFWREAVTRGLTDMPLVFIWVQVVPIRSTNGRGVYVIILLDENVKGAPGFSVSLTWKVSLSWSLYTARRIPLGELMVQNTINRMSQRILLSRLNGERAVSLGVNRS